jgi:hypothetical protein
LTLPQKNGIFNLGKLLYKGGGHQKWQQKKQLWLVLSADPATIRNQSVKEKKAIALKSTSFVNIAINTHCIVKQSKEEVQ